MKKILIVDDDPITLRILCSTVEKHGYQVLKAASGEAAFASLENNEMDAMILDLNLPDINGLEILRQVRNHPVLHSIVIMVVTENDDKLEAIISLEMGADDYITKPFHQRELIARLNAIFRRIPGPLAETHSNLVFNDLHIDIKKRLVKRQDKIINLTFKEFEILVLLAANPGEVLPRESIMNAIGGLDYSPETRTIDMHISSIRKKLNDTNKEKIYIDTVSGVGYRFRK